MLGRLLLQRRQKRRRRAKGETLQALARSYGVTHPAIMRALERQGAQGVIEAVS